MKEELVSPCGMNCRLCYAYQRDKNKCLGCRDKNNIIANSCLRCIIRNCPIIKDNKYLYCYDCHKYPCQRLKQLDKRYKTKYNMSMLENLNNIKDNGIEFFLSNEEKRWKCQTCGKIICVHHNKCEECNKIYN